MATINDAQATAWKLANPNIDYNPSAALAKKWLALKAEGTFIGVPIGPELPLDDGTVCQSFTAGCVLRWHGGDTVTVE